MTKYYILIVFIPIINFLVLTLFGYKLGNNVSKQLIILLLNNFGIQLFLIFSLFQNFLKIKYLAYTFSITSWFQMGLLASNYEIIYDQLSVTMSLLVVIISIIVHLYSLYYMSNDPYLNKFLSYLSLFTFFMLLLVTSTNLIQFFLGWEGIGLCSFLLISFWNKRAETKKAALKAVLINKIGDCAFLAALGLVYTFVKSLDLNIIFLVLPIFTNTLINLGSYSFCLTELISFLFFISVMSKSAQIGLHIWIADAMEGPTPVSALIHAATMVTAGVYLIIRYSIIFDLAPCTSQIILFVGAITSVFSGIVAFLQYDIKKIIAYSTCSQLGYMVASCGNFGYQFAFIHIVTHGFFKAILFLSAGIIIHNIYEEQDIRKMGGLLRLFPYTYIFFIIGSFSLMGLPFFSGYYSKDAIVEIAGLTTSTLGTISYYIICFSIILTAIYSLKLLYYVFWTEPNGPMIYYYKDPTVYIFLNKFKIFKNISELTNVYKKKLNLNRDIFNKTFPLHSNNSKIKKIKFYNFSRFYILISYQNMNEQHNTISLIKIIPKFKKINEAPLMVLFFLFFLSFSSIYIGYLLKDFISSPGTIIYTNNTLCLVKKNIFLFYEYIALKKKIIPFLYIFLGFSLNIIIIETKNYFILKILTLNNMHYKFKLYRDTIEYFSNGWFLNFMFLKYVKKSLNNFKNIFYFEKLVFELLGPSGLLILTFKITKILNWFHQEEKHNTILSFTIAVWFSSFFIFTFVITLYY